MDLNSISARISEGSPVDRAIGTGLLILGLIVLFHRKKALGNLARCWPLVLFLIYCLISLIWSDFPDVGLKRLIRVIGDWVMVSVIWTDPKPMTAFVRLVARCAYTLIPLSILTAKYYAFGRSYGYWIGEVTYVGVTDNKNTLGAICLLFGIASVWHLLNLFGEGSEAVNRNRRLLVHFAILTMTIYLLAIADSMTSWSCGMLVVFVLFALRFPMFAKRRILIHLLAAVTIAVPLFIAILGAAPGTLQAMGRSATLTDRTLIWAWVIKLMPNEWIGAGFSSFWLGHRLDVMIANVTHTWVPNQAHNGYLEVYANLGWIGVGLLGLVISWGYFRIVGAWRAKTQGSELMLAYFLIGVISNLTEASFFRALVPIWLFFIIAITMPPVEDLQTSEQTVKPVEWSRKLTAMAPRDAAWSG